MNFMEAAPIRELIPIDYARMNLGRRWWNCALGRIPEGLEYKRVLSRYLAKLTDNVKQGRGLLFHGEYSTGKTAAAAIVAMSTVEHGGTAYVAPMHDLSDLKIDGTLFTAGVTLWDRMLTVDLLVLDDIGANYASEWARSLSERLIRERSNIGRAIIYTTNRGDLIDDSGIGEILRTTALPVEVLGRNWRDDEAVALRAAILGEDESK